jgi:ferredoxin
MSDEAVNTISVKVDLTRCAGHGRYILDAPEVFGYDDVENQAFVRADADLAANKAGIEAAIAGCPEVAISWSQE